METILIWLGSGFAFAVGTLSGIVLMGMFLKKKTSSERISEQANVLLEERNQIGLEQIEALRSIVIAIKNK